jgi:hypothetical protein
MKKTLIAGAVLLSLISLVVSAKDLPEKNDVPGAVNNLPLSEALTGNATGPGDLFFRTAGGEYIKISDDNYAEIVNNISDATPFGKMVYEGKTYYIANAGKYSGSYLSWSYLGYIGTYNWTNSAPWKQDSSLCLTVDNDKAWKMYEYEKAGKKYAVIGNYDYTQKCFLPVSATENYKPIKLQSRYVNENAACVWQSKDKCAPYVTYYTESQSASLAISVSGGKLYQGNALFDTTKADISHSKVPVAIFVMDVNGGIYASKQFKVYMFHHSSILAGRDVAFAGEIQVEQGVIKKITNCSGHYQPDISFAKQLIDSLNRQGYSAPLSVEPCNSLLYGDLPN